MNKKSSYKIIICDNQPIVVQGLKSIFEPDSAYQIIGCVKDGASLRNALIKSPNSANTLLLDLKLPKTNTYRLVKDFVVMYPNLHIIAFTDNIMPKLIQDMMEFGIHAYLSKNASLEEIKESIERVHKGERFISASAHLDQKRISSEKQNKLLEPKDDFTKFSSLTEREMDIIILLSRGLTNKEMASKLNLSVYTIETHRKNVMKKLQLKTGAQLIYFAAQQGII